MKAAADTIGLDPAKIDAVLEMFKAAGHSPVSPPILQPADVFLDLTGEDIRRRLFLTNGTDGVDLCLRPDFTIPVCRHHLARKNARLPAAYCYSGPVFRQRADGLGEIAQLGAESLGRSDIAEADADLLALSVKALETFGLKQFDPDR
ncbi:ATP phosphoribosyltransferase regulatory subunit [Roseibium salinum]|uniref:ATP phosphoribosyltransferase regulatory subunit n=1 Tax=Roseibium salinum TaxID=1604349 RepID=UPI003621BF32